MTSIIPLINGIITKRSQYLSSSPYFPRSIPLQHGFPNLSYFPHPNSCNNLPQPAISPISPPSRTPSAWCILSPDLDDRVARSLSVSPLLTATAALGGFCRWMCSPFGCTVPARPLWWSSIIALAETELTGCPSRWGGRIPVFLGDDLVCPCRVAHVEDLSMIQRPCSFQLDGLSPPHYWYPVVGLPLCLRPGI